MRSTTSEPRSAGARRERLASPLTLGIVGAAFAAAFVALVPSQDMFELTVDQGDVPRTAADGGERDIATEASVIAPDQLQYAYLRARASAGRLDDADTFAAALVLARAGRLAQSRELLSLVPTLVLDAPSRYRLDLAIAAGEWQRDRASEGARARLVALLERLPGERRLQTSEALRRAAGLSIGLQDPALVAAMHEALALHEPARAAQHLGRCGRALAVQGAHAAAANCLVLARDAGNDESTRFSLGLELLALSGDSPATDALIEELLTSPAARATGLEGFATLLLANGRPGSAARAYARLADIDHAADRSRWLHSAARWSEAAGRPAEAAAMLERLSPAQLDADNGSARREIDRLLLAAGQEDEALRRIAARIAAHPGDTEALARGVRLAQAAGQSARALAWNALWLERHDDDLAAIDRQVTLALASGDPMLARRWARHAVALEPDEPARHETLAQLAQWSGDPELALAESRWLAERRGDRKSLTAVAELAEALRRPALAADALLTLAMRRVPQDRELERLVTLYERDGQPTAAADAIEQVMQRHGISASALRSLAAMQERHLLQQEALATWQRFADTFGRSAEETLARVELLWKLGNRDAAAALSDDLLDLPSSTGFGTGVSEFRASLLAEIGWQYRKPALSALVRPLISLVENDDQRLRHARRSIDTLEVAGRLDAARAEAEALWQSSGDVEFGLSALRLAVDAQDSEAVTRIQRAAQDDDALLASADWWSHSAAAALHDGRGDDARVAYERALALEPDDIGAIGGLLWLAIGDNDVALIESLLSTRLPAIEQQPTLWPAIAMAHVTIGDDTGSLVWFERATASLKSDYGLLLAWADALERAGRAEHARRVRAHTVATLRPRLVAGIGGHQQELLQQYASVLSRYGRAEDNEAWMRFVINTDLDTDGDARIWREDMAIAWLMSTERHEHARMIMVRRHERRLGAPSWQDLALALRSGDQTSVNAMLDSGAGLSAAGRMLALRSVGRDADAFALALRTLDTPRSAEDLRVAREQYLAMRGVAPNDVGARFTSSEIGGLSIAESALSLRASPGTRGLNVTLDYVQRRFDSDRLDTRVADGRNSLLLALSRKDSVQDLGITLGVDAGSAEDLVYGGAWWARRDRRRDRQVRLSLGWNEPADESVELRLAGKRDRLGLDLETALGGGLFARLGLEAHELSTRVQQSKLARGLATRGEFGARGSAGSLAWSASLAGAHVERDRVDALPEELALSRDSTLDRVIASRNTSLMLNASLGSDNAYAAPFWRVDTGIGHAWPDETFGLMIDAGAGRPLLGRDQLGVTLRHEAGIGGRNLSPDLTRFGIDYRYQF